MVTTRFMPDSTITPSENGPSSTFSVTVFKWEEKGLECTIRFGGTYFGAPIRISGKAQYTMAHWCGYVTLPEDVWPLDAEELSLLSVHGGITYGDNTLPDHEGTYGFDCAHSGDDAPGSEWHMFDRVLQETEQLAHQIRKVLDARRVI